MKVCGAKRADILQLYLDSSGFFLSPNHDDTYLFSAATALSSAKHALELGKKRTLLCEILFPG